MAHQEITGDIDAITIDIKDDVATALKDLPVGQSISYRLENEIRQLVVNAHIPFGHKVAIRQVDAGKPVYKYGEVIGRAIEEIRIGDHVHVHNLEGIRGRGDKVMEHKGESA